MSGAEHDYDFSRKRHWRRWAWNCIKARLGKPANEALVIYLPGATDLDRPVAISKGFNPNNLLAIDRVKENVESVRDEGGLAFQADVFDAADAMLQKHRPDVILYDLCCGFSFKLCARLTDQMAMVDGSFETTFVLNVMGGRDSDYTKYKKFGHDAGDDGHRGKLILRVVACSILEYFLQDAYSGKLAEAVLKTIVADSSQYISNSGQRFDSIVFYNPLNALLILLHRKDPAAAKEMFDYLMGFSPLVCKEVALTRPKVITAKRKLASILAHRTMRME